jgi:hypothetical protein
MSEPIPTFDASEAECAICAQWPLGLRPVMRSSIYGLPLREPVCAKCQIAFWANITSGRGRSS